MVTSWLSNVTAATGKLVSVRTDKEGRRNGTSVGDEW